MNVNAALDHLESHSALAHVPSDRDPGCLSGGEKLLLDIMASLSGGQLHEAASRLDDANWLAVVGAIHALRPIRASALTARRLAEAVRSHERTLA